MQMLVTSNLITNMGLPTGTDTLLVSAALDWMAENTDFDLSTEAKVQDLPASAKVFITKYADMLKGTKTTVSSETIGGMSRSFKSSSDSERAFRVLALQLLGKHYTGGQVRTAPDVSGWR